MYTQKTLKLWEWILKFMYYTGGGPFWWNQKTGRAELVTSWLDWSRWYFGFLLSTLASASVFGSYVYRLRLHGFQISNVHELYHATSVPLVLMSSLFQFGILFKKTEIVNVINQFATCFGTFKSKYKLPIPPGKNKKVRKERNAYEVILNFFTFYGFVSLPGTFAMLYIFRCDLHYLSMIVADSPYLCTVEGDELWDATVKKLTFGWVQWIIVAQSGGVCLLFVGMLIYPFGFMGVEFLKVYMDYQPISKLEEKEWETFKRNYRTLQLMLNRVNESLGSYVFPGYILLVIWEFTICFTVCIKGTVGGIFTFGCGTFTVVWALSYNAGCKNMWVCSEMGSELLHVTRRESRNKDRNRFLDSCQQITIRFGDFGRMDRDMFIFIGDHCINFTINTLMM